MRVRRTSEAIATVIVAVAYFAFMAGLILGSNASHEPRVTLAMQTSGAVTFGICAYLAFREQRKRA